MRAVQYCMLPARNAMIHSASLLSSRAEFLKPCETAARKIIRRGPSPNKFTRKYLTIFLSSYTKLVHFVVTAWKVQAVIYARMFFVLQEKCPILTYRNLTHTLYSASWARDMCEFPGKFL
jgi:hypothetical protein